MKRYRIDFDTPPEAGTQVKLTKELTLTLASSKPHTRKDGTETHLLTWVASDGRIARSGMKSHYVIWQKLPK